MGDRAVPPWESRIEILCREGVWILTLHGEHAIATRPGLEEELARLGEAVGRVVVDLSLASFLDSSVIRSIAAPVPVDGARPPVSDIVAPKGTFAGRLAALVGLDAVVPVHETLDEALGGGSRS